MEPQGKDPNSSKQEPFISWGPHLTVFLGSEPKSSGSGHFVGTETATSLQVFRAIFSALTRQDLVRRDPQSVGAGPNAA